MCVCATFAVFTDCESCTRSISTNPGSMEVGEYGPTRGACFVAHRLEVVVVPGLLLISWCVLGGVDFFLSFLSYFFFYERTRPAASMRPPCLIYLYTSNYRQLRGCVAALLRTLGVVRSSYPTNATEHGGPRSQWARGLPGT